MICRFDSFNCRLNGGDYARGKSLPPDSSNARQTKCGKHEGGLANQPELHGRHDR